MYVLSEAGTNQDPEFRKVRRQPRKLEQRREAGTEHCSSGTPRIKISSAASPSSCSLASCPTGTPLGLARGARLPRLSLPLTHPPPPHRHQNNPNGRLDSPKNCYSRNHHRAGRHLTQPRSGVWFIGFRVLEFLGIGKPLSGGSGFGLRGESAPARTRGRSISKSEYGTLWQREHCLCEACVFDPHVARSIQRLATKALVSITPHCQAARKHPRISGLVRFT